MLWPSLQVRIGAVLALALAGAGTEVRAAAPEERPIPTTITVDGRLLSGPFAFAERRDGRLFLPVTTIAEALGERLSVDPLTRTVQVARHTGVVAQLNISTGQVLENNVPVFLSTSTGDIPVPPDARALLLPVELAAALLDVSVIVDSAAGTIRVTREPPQVTVAQGGEHGFFDLYQTRYGYHADIAQAAFNHNLLLNATGRAFDGLVDGTANFAGSLQQGLFDFRYGLLTYGRPGGQQLMLGDVSSGGDLSFIGTPLRGAWYRQPIAAFDVTTFAGMTRSGAAPDPLRADVPPSLNFDTPVAGAYLTLGRTPGSLRAPVTNSTGGMWFYGPNRHGGIASTAFRYATPLHTFQAELGVGLFEQPQLDGTVRRATGFLIDTTEALTPTDALTLVAGFTHVDQTYLSPQSGSVTRPMNLLSGGMHWKVTPWLNTSIAARHVERLDVSRPDLPGHPTDDDVTGTVAIAAPGYPTVVVNHSQGYVAELGPREVTLVNASHRLLGANLFADFTRMKIGKTPVQLGLTVGAGTRLADLLYVSAFQTVNGSGGLSGGVDLATPSFFTPAVALGAGVGYTHSAVSGIALMAKLTLSASLPGRQRLQLTIAQTAFGSQALLQLSGPLYERAGGGAAARLGLQQISTIGSFSGRIFQDADLDGAFDPAVDRPLPGVQVLVDGSNAVLTDEEGRYHVANIQAGTHAVQLNLLTVRADLSLLAEPVRKVALLPDRDAIIDFRLIRTGRVSGTVWADGNGNGEIDEGELPLSSVRVVSGKRDTLTNEQGEFLLGDLPQGTHTVLVDEKTLPDGYRPAAPSVEVQVKPPRETREVRLPIVERPREIEIKQF